MINEHQARFNTVQAMILEGGFTAYPGWKTFKYADDFGAQRGDKDGTARFVFDTLSVLKKKGLLESHDKADTDFSVQLMPDCYQALCKEVEAIDAEKNTGTQLIEYLKAAAPDTLKAAGLEMLKVAVVSWITTG